MHDSVALALHTGEDEWIWRPLVNPPMVAVSDIAADNPKGFRINGVSKGGTAETIGLQAGDILTHFGDKPVKNVYDFMGALGAFKAGDKVVIQWLRGDQPMQAEATLKGRQ